MSLDIDEMKKEGVSEKVSMLLVCAVISRPLAGFFCKRYCYSCSVSFGPGQFTLVWLRYECYTDVFTFFLD